jgi:glycosyltransferase involved in cell wall biosynthesis
MPGDSHSPRRPRTRREDIVLVLSSDHAPLARELTGPVKWDRAAHVSLSEAVAMVRRGGRQIGNMALVGSPADIGYSVAVALIALAWPRSVVVLDPRRGRLVRASTGRFLTQQSPAAVAQAVASVAALGGQSLAAGVPRRRSTKLSSGLARLTYLRPVVGTSAVVGGAVTHTHEVIKAMGEEGVAVDVLTTDAGLVPARDYPAGLPVRWEHFRASKHLAAIPASAGFAADLALLGPGVRRASDADVIYQRHVRFSLVGAMVASITGKPLFLEYNGPEDYFGEHWQSTPLLARLSRLEDAALRAADRIFVVSSVIRDDLVGRGFPEATIVVNPNGVDPDRFDRGGGSAVRKLLGIAEGETVVGFVGSFGPWHGAPVLAHAFGAIGRDRSDVRLLLVGDGPEKADVLRILADAGAAPQVVDVGKVPASGIPAYLDACDVLASPHCPIPGQTRFFGSPTKLFEYMASGKGIVATALEQISEVLEDGVLALLMTPGDADSLQAGLLALIDDQGLSERLGRAAQRAAREHHTWRQNAKTIATAFDELAASTR